MSFIEQWTAQGQNKRQALFLEMQREYLDDAAKASDEHERNVALRNAARMADKAKAASK